ncbi:MAG: c-type cytochrome domain-containing protein [Mariniblastus sp.]
MSLSRLKRILFGFAFAFLTFAICGSSAWAQATPKQRQAVKQIKSNIDRAGRQFKSKKMEASAKYINDANKQIQALAAIASPELMELIKPEFERLSTAHKLLTDNGQTLDELKQLPAAMTGDGEKVSFKTAVAPILVAKCGNCHVSRNRGDFSAATFEALDKSTTISYGFPADSRLIQVIESGEMPKGGLKVEDAELKTLKLWIKQGAKFDGESAQKALGEYVTTAAPASAAMAPMKPALPTGKETVSFGIDVAPVLLESCGDCHIRRNPRGNFSMASFRTFLRGGDGGTPIVPGKSKDSPIIKRLRGEGDLMPPDGKLDDSVIEKIATWIDEGAKFDGGNAQLDMVTIAAKVKADSQSHDELKADRNKLARKTWKLVMDSVESKTLRGDSFLVTGSTNESRLTDVLQMCEDMVPDIKKAFRADAKKPLVKGNVSIFVFDKRYDFSEFGKMVEKRDFPKEIKAHWGYTTIDAYATVLMTRNQGADDVKASLAHQISALHCANMAADMPRWFADGVGLLTAKKVLPKDESLRSLDVRAEAVAAEMTKVDDFVQNRMPADRAALVSYLFIKQLKAKSGNYRKLMAMMKDGKSFEVSFVTAYGGTPSELLGQNDPRKRGRN